MTYPHPNEFYLYSPDDLGDDAEMWYRRVHETLIERDYLYYILQGSGKTASRLHICPCFPNHECDHDHNERYDTVPYCDRKQSIGHWRAKSTAVYPPAYSPICGYCIYRFIHWWFDEHE